MTPNKYCRKCGENSFLPHCLDTTHQENIDELVRDLTTVDRMAKSEVRSRISHLLAEARKEGAKEMRDFLRDKSYSKETIDEIAEYLLTKLNQNE